MNLDVTSRLQEQSELIMVLKSRADFEMKRRKEAEYKLLEELSKSQDLQHQLLDCQRRMCDAEVNNRVLRSTINDLSEEILSQTLVRSSNTVIPKVDVSMQTEIEIHHNDNTSVGPRMEEIFETHLLKFSELYKEINELSQLVNETKSVFAQHQKTIQDNLKILTDLFLTVCKNERQSLLLQLENERCSNEAIRTKLNIVETDKLELENTIIKLKEQKDREMKKFNANKQVKRLKEELANSYLQLEQIKQST
ncbi:hypothetical protein KSF78_0005200 [Schistosoma japonicum]|nr:hypothetical protein KSF78_0005200 [Schistosoma japonicum]